MDLATAYQSTLDYLYRFVDYSLTHSFQLSPEQFHLDRMVDFLDRLGNPHQQYPVYHIAGTKGKGSVAALIARSLQEAGFRTGLYTSPHLEDYTERIRVDGVEISHADLVALVDELRPLIETIPGLTTFEVTTALGFLYFARQRVDAAVIEVGLGGRVDATNVVSPLVSVITTLSMDHMNVLGDTLAKIAAEKAGIIKQGIPVVSAPQHSEAIRVIQGVCAERDARLYQVGLDLRYHGGAHSLDGQEMDVWRASDQPRMDAYLEADHSGDWRPVRLKLPLLGYHQVINAATAYLAIQVANQTGPLIPEQAIQAGFRSVEWPGRFEILNRAPYVVVDSAHNPEAAMRLRQTLDDYFPGRPVILVFGVSEDKDVSGIFAELSPRVERVIATQADHPRAMPAGQIVDQAHKWGLPAQAECTLAQALTVALRCAREEQVIVITGSLFVVSEARKAWFSLDVACT